MTQFEKTLLTKKINKVKYLNKYYEIYYKSKKEKNDAIREIKTLINEINEIVNKLIDKGNLLNEELISLVIMNNEMNNINETYKKEWDKLNKGVYKYSVIKEFEGNIYKFHSNNKNILKLNDTQKKDTQISEIDNNENIIYVRYQVYPVGWLWTYGEFKIPFRWMEILEQKK